MARTAGRTEPADLSVMADLVASATRSTPGVRDLHAGAFGEVATYLPGRKVTGVRIAESVTEVHVVADMTVPLLATAAAIRAAVQPLVGTEVQVFIEDVDPS